MEDLHALPYNSKGPVIQDHICSLMFLQWPNIGDFILMYFIFSLVLKFESHPAWLSGYNEVNLISITVLMQELWQFHRKTLLGKHKAIQWAAFDEARSASSEHDPFEPVIAVEINVSEFIFSN